MQLTRYHLFPHLQILSDEDDITYPQVPSSSSSGSGDSDPTNSTQDLEPALKSSSKSSRAKKHDKNSSATSSSSSGITQPARVVPSVPSRGQTTMYNSSLPIVYAPHSSPAPLNQYIHQFPCKYPGCNQVSD